MGDHAVEVIRRLFDDASRNSDATRVELDALDPATLDAVFDFFDPEVELREDPSFPEVGVYRGLEAVATYFRQFTENFDEFVLEVEEVIALREDRALALFRLRTRGSGSGAATVARPGWIFTTRGEKVARIEAYLDRGEALTAAGLES